MTSLSRRDQTKGIYLGDSFVKYQAYLIVFNSLDRIAYFKAKQKIQTKPTEKPLVAGTPFLLELFLKKYSNKYCI